MFFFVNFLCDVLVRRSHRLNRGDVWRAGALALKRFVEQLSTAPFVVEPTVVQENGDRNIFASPCLSWFVAVASLASLLALVHVWSSLGEKTKGMHRGLDRGRQGGR